MGDIDLPDATTLGEFNIHMRMLRSEVHKLVVAMPHMATKADIAELSRKFEGYATHDDLRTLRYDVETLRSQIENGSVKGTLKNWAEWARALAAIAAFGAAAAYFLVGLLNRLGA